MREEWMEKHVAFMKRPVAYRPAELRRRALVAIDAGGLDGAPMGDVHVAIRSARLPAWLVNLVVDRLVADGHVHRERIQTAGRPRVQLWSFRHAAEELRDDMAYTGAWVQHDFTRPRWEGMIQENIIVDVLRRVGDSEVRVKDLCAAAGQIYVDATPKLEMELFKGRNDTQLTKGQMHTLLVGMVRHRRIRQNAEGDAFTL